MTLKLYITGLLRELLSLCILGTGMLARRTVLSQRGSSPEKGTLELSFGVLWRFHCIVMGNYFGNWTQFPDLLISLKGRVGGHRVGGGLKVPNL